MNDSLAKRQRAVNTDSNVTPRTPAGDTFSALVVQVFQLSGLLSAAGDRLAQPAGQTSARWQVLAAAEQGPATVAQIARALELTRQSVQRLANVLVAEGLGTYQANPKDKRADLFVLTAAGRAALAEIQTRQRVWADALGAEIGEEDLRRGLELLHKVAGALKKTPTDL